MVEIFHHQLKIAVDSGHISLRRDQLDAIFLNWYVMRGEGEREGGGRGELGRRNFLHQRNKSVKKFVQIVFLMIFMTF